MRYSINKYVLLTNRGESESFDEVIKDECNDPTLLQKHFLTKTKYGKGKPPTELKFLDQCTKKSKFVPSHPLNKAK